MICNNCFTAESRGRRTIMTGPVSWLTSALLAAGLFIAPAAASAQAMPAEYQEVLTTLGKTGDFKDNVLKVNIPRSDLRDNPAAACADAVWIRRLGGLDQGCRRDGSDDGRPRAHRGRSEPGDVGGARPRPRGDGAPQSFLLGAAAHLLHARARHGQRRRSGATLEARHRPHQPGDASARRRSAAGARGSARRSTARRLPRSLATRRAERTRLQDHDRPAGHDRPRARRGHQRAHGAEYVGGVHRDAMRTRWSPAMSRCSRPR